MGAAVVRRPRRDPAGQELGYRLPDLHAERAAGGEGITALGPPHLHREVAVRAHGDRAEHVDLGEELDEVAPARRARLHEVAAVRGEAGDLEDVQHVVHVELGEMVGGDRTHEVAVAAEVELLPVEQLVDVRVERVPSRS